MKITKAIRRRCVYCSETLSDARNCTITHCSLHPYRMGKNPFHGKVKPGNYLPPLKAIRRYCLECAGGSPSEVRECGGAGADCDIYDFRFGDNPHASDAKREAGRKSMQRLKNRQAAKDFETDSSQERESKGANNKPEKAHSRMKCSHHE